MTDDELAAATFRCGLCGGTFDKGRPDAEAMAECAEAFGPQDPADLAVVCDDCFNRMQAAYPPAMYEEDRAAGIDRTIILPEKEVAR